MAIPSPKIDYTPYPTVQAGGGGARPLDTRASPDAFGAAIGGAVEKGGEEGFQVIQQHQEMANHIAANDTLANGFVPEVNGIVSNYKKLSGMDAVVGKEAAQKAVLDTENKYINNAPNPAQKEYLSYFVRQHAIQQMSNISNHADEQYTQHENIVNTQTEKMYQDNAANNYKDPNAVDLAVGAVEGNRRRYYEDKVGRDDQSKPIVDQMVKEGASSVAMSAINTALDNNDHEAAAFYTNKYFDVLSGKDKLDAEKKVTALNSQQNASSYVDNLLIGKPSVPVGTPHYEAIQTKANVAQLAQKNGLDPNIAFALHGVESSFGKGIRPDSSYKDDFQTEPKLRDAGFTDDSMESSVHNAAKIWNENSADLTKRLNRTPTVSESYLAYNQGGAGATALLNAAPTDTAIQALSKIMPVDDAREHILKNGGTPTMSAQAFSQQIEGRFQNYYDAQKITIPAGQNVSDAIRNQTSAQLPTPQQVSNPHDYYNQIQRNVPAAQAAIDLIPDDKTRDLAQKRLAYKIEEAKRDDASWKNDQAQVAMKFADDQRYTSMDQIPQTVKNSLREAGQLSAVEKSMTDKLNVKKDNTYGGTDFLRTMGRLVTDDKADQIGDLAGLQQTYGDTPGLHSSGFKALQNMLKTADTPEGKAQVTSQFQYLSDLRDKMPPGAEGDKQFDTALPLFFKAYNDASANKKDPSALMSLDTKDKNSFASQIKLPTPAELTSKKIDNSVSWISKFFGGNQPINTTLTKEEQIMADYQDGKLTEEQKNQQLTGLGVALSIHAPRP